MKQHKQKSEETSKDINAIEKDVCEKVLSIPDMANMCRVAYSVYSQAQQKYYTYMYQSQNAGSSGASMNGECTGDQNTGNGMMYMPNQMMQMQYMGGMNFPGSSTQKQPAPEQNK